LGNGHWQLEGRAAELYQRYLVPAITTKWGEDLIDRARPRAGEAVLDVACGTGVVTRLAAKAIGDGHVTGLDLNAGMLPLPARCRAKERQSPGSRPAPSICRLLPRRSMSLFVSSACNFFLISH
jgi:SAM-dependent methyltransferase